MTTTHSASNHVSISARYDLPRPDMQFSETSRQDEPGITTPETVSAASIQDTGRIRFGGSFRMPIAR